MDVDIDSRPSLFAPRQQRPRRSEGRRSDCRQVEGGSKRGRKFRRFRHLTQHRPTALRRPKCHRRMERVQRGLHLGRRVKGDALDWGVLGFGSPAIARLPIPRPDPGVPRLLQVLLHLHGGRVGRRAQLLPRSVLADGSCLRIRGRG